MGEVTGLTGLTGLDAAQLCTGGEMTKERLLLLWKEGHSQGLHAQGHLNDRSNHKPRNREAFTVALREWVQLSGKLARNKVKSKK